MIDWLHVGSRVLHLLATVIWIGGLLTMTLLVWPEVRALLEKENQSQSASAALIVLLDRLRKRFYPLANLSLGALIATGLYQMAVSPFYEGVMQFNNAWSRAIFLKHVAVIGMVGVGAIMQWGVLPALERSALLLSRGKEVPDLDKLGRREVFLTRLNTLLGVLVLAFTAVASSL